LKAALLLLASGYVLPSWSILKWSAKARDAQPSSTMRVEGTAVVSPSAARDVANLLGVQWTSGELPLSFAVEVKFPGRCRYELSSPESTRVVAAMTSNGKRRTEGGDLPALAAAADETCALIALHSSGDGESHAELEKHLNGLKVNKAVTSIARFRGTIAYVVGDAAADAPQLWLYKDTFEPARIRYTDDKQNKWDVHFVDYSSPASGDTFPRVVVVQKGGEPILRMTALKGDLKPKLDDARF
jgi:hypothetical protein